MRLNCPQIIQKTYFKSTALLPGQRLPQRRTASSSCPENSMPGEQSSSASLAVSQINRSAGFSAALYRNRLA
jgi:hypothetical protein